jgi:MFS family permease
MREARQVALLACAQGLLLTQGVTLIAVNGIAGMALAPDRRLATLPITTYVLGGAAVTLPASHFMKRHGRRAGFFLGGALGLVGTCIGALSLLAQSFLGLCLGTVLLGACNAFGQYYRFAAADIAAPENKSRAVSLTLAGGLIGAFLGPRLASFTRDLLTPRFVASYCALFLLILVSLALVSSLRFPAQTESERTAQGRPLREIAAQPAFVVAVLSGTVAYGVMNLLMSATPLAMDLCGFDFEDAAHVLQWHVVGMFAPSFFTGSLIRRFGVLPVLSAGLALCVGCVAVALSGETLPHFFGSLVLLGVGWNFLYIGGTTLLTETYAPEEKAKAQGTNDFVVFASMAAASLTSGIVVTGAGFARLNWLALPLLVLHALALVWLALRRRAAPTVVRGPST